MDVICFAPDADAFACAVWKAFGTRPEFRIWQKVRLGRPVVAHITDAGWTIEIFGQAVPISEQSGWRHFLVEQRLLTFGGEALRIAVMTQRTTGMKAEPAFAAVLGLDGDPFETMLRLQRCSDIELIAMLRHRGFG